MSKFEAQNAGNAISRVQISKIFRGACLRTPLVVRGPYPDTVRNIAGSAPDEDSHTGRQQTMLGETKRKKLFDQSTNSCMYVQRQ